MTLVKICGIKTIDEARAASAAGAWAIGEVFAESRRRIEVEKAADINRRFRANLIKVGVFADQPLDYVLYVVKECRLDMVQLHGSEPPDYFAALPCPAIKSFRVIGPVEPAEVGRWPAWAYLFDGPSPGSGQNFDWTWLEAFRGSERVILAGGLSPDNVTDAVVRLRPMAVDVSSGVEYPGGGKDPALIRLFVQRVKEADEHVS